MRALVALTLAAGSCTKVPIYDVEAGFDRADVSWFAEEETLFVFWEVSAEQGINADSLIEISYATDDGRVEWTPLEDLVPVHTHEPVDCGVDGLCGSFSLHVPSEPRGVHLRMRYHRDGELSLDADTVYNAVGNGLPFTHRSFVTYGVFDELNERIQWRGRHQFPTVRNEEAEALGLRRSFRIENRRHGIARLASGLNPYGYGVTCPDSLEAADLPAVETDERAVFDVEDLPVEASDSPVVCADSTVQDATGSFTTGTTARKNPEVKPAFPLLASPINDATVLPFFLAPCDETLGEEHEAMQRQRLGMDFLTTTCIDDWEQDGFADTLTELFTDAVEANRSAGRDMVLVIGLHRDDAGMAEVVEEALEELVPEERGKNTPRLAGAFVFDSVPRGIDDPGVEHTTLWCPASIDDVDTGIPDASTTLCALAPDNPDTELGPFSFNVLPILPSRSMYEDFIATYSEDLAGSVTQRRYLTPEFSTTADHIDLGDYGMVTFLDDEIISADDDDAFSYCTSDEIVPVVFRSRVLSDPDFAQKVAANCEALGFEEEVCAYAQIGVLPLELMGQWHQIVAEDTYELGLYWDFPFLLRMEYETYLAGSLTAFGVSVPFGLAESGEAYLGSFMWTVDEFSLESELTQCSRFCDHPTFDAAGVYQVMDNFAAGYANRCYLPDYPVVGDSGFPSDP